MAEVQEHTDLISGSEDTQLESHLKALGATTKWLQVIGIFTFLLTLANMGVIVYSFYSPVITITLGEYGVVSGQNWLFSTVLLAGCIITVVAFERMRKSGDTLFEELSDELQWRVGYAQESPQASGKPPAQGKNLARTSAVIQERPPLKVRVVLRSYVQATDLPIIPGKKGPAFYVAVNLFFNFILLYFALLS